MARKSWGYGVFSSASRPRWQKTILDGNVWINVTPQPGHTYTRDTWPPRGRGRGESLCSERRLDAKLRALEVMRLREEGHTWEAIARATGYASASGAYHAMRRTIDRVDNDKRRKDYHA